MVGSSKRGRGRRKSGGANRGGKIAVETHASNIINQQNPRDQVLVSSPVLPRYPTRRSRRILSQLATLHSPLRTPRRCVNKTTIGVLNETNVESLSRNIDNARPELQPPTLPQHHEDAAICTPAASSRSSSPDNNTSTRPMDLGRNTSVGSTVWSVPIIEDLLDLDNLTSKILSQCQEPQENQEIAPSPEDRPEKSTCVPERRQCLSSMTKYAEKLQDEIEDDPDEVESSLDPAFIIVDGHRVKKETAPLLTEIFKKYGDIAAESDYKPSDYLSLSLESLCDIYRKLEQQVYSNITHIELNRMLESVRAFELHKVNVGWLRERLEYISETKTMSLDYLRVKKEKSKHDASVGRVEKELGDLEKELEDLHEKISVAKQKLVEERAKADWSEKVIRETKSRVEILLNQSLVHGTSDE